MGTNYAEKIKTVQFRFGDKLQQYILENPKIELFVPKTGLTALLRGLTRHRLMFTQTPYLVMIVYNHYLYTWYAFPHSRAFWYCCGPSKAPRVGDQSRAKGINLTLRGTIVNTTYGTHKNLCIHICLARSPRWFKWLTSNSTCV